MKKNLLEIINFYRRLGFLPRQAQQRCVQDLILAKISDSPYRDDVTIKGGVVIYQRSQALRRSTLDIDMDFMHLGIDDASLTRFIETLNRCDDGVRVEITQPFLELHHADYRGKRIVFSLHDSYENVITYSKINLGVETLGLESQEQLFLSTIWDEH